MSIYGKNPLKIFLLRNSWTDFNETWLVASGTGVLHNVYINNDPVMTLTYFRARSTWMANAFEWGETVKMSFEGIADLR